MPSIDWPALLSQAPALAIAVAFGFFILRFLDRQDKQLAAQSALSSAERKERDASWQQFLKEEREARATWANTSASQLSQLATLITATNTLITQHDTWQRAFNERKE